MIALLRAGKDGQAQRLSNRRFLPLLGPASHGAVEQAVLRAKPGWYVDAGFMDTQDGREHTRLASRARSGCPRWAMTSAIGSTRLG